jgi:hypothetical protein
MTETAQFRYAQARLQARHGERPAEPDWRRLQAVGELSNYLQLARQTKLHRWVSVIQARDSSHGIELALRRQFRTYIEEVARWLPARWRKPVRLLQRLPDLPALQHLLAGGTAHDWMMDDPWLHPFASDSVVVRRECLQDSDCATLLRGWRDKDPLYLVWLDYWHSQWPEAPRLTAGLEQLCRLFIAHLHARQEPATHPPDPQRETLARRLEAAFRRYSCQPGAACAHLALIALDLEKLRGDLVTRRLFTDTIAATP